MFSLLQITHNFFWYHFELFNIDIIFMERQILRVIRYTDKFQKRVTCV